MIKNIFQTWKSKTIHQPILKKWQESWKKYNPDFEYVLWDDDDNRKFITEHFPSFLEIYNSYNVEIKRADAVRYFYLYKYGGVYADLDFECLKSFEPLVKDMYNTDTDVIVGSLGKMDSEKTFLHNIPNALMISKPGADFWKLVIGSLTNKKSNPENSPELETGPVFLKTCIRYYTNKNDISIDLYKKNIFEGIECDFSSKICIADDYIFYPLNWDNEEHKKISLKKGAKDVFPNSYAITYWMHSWQVQGHINSEFLDIQ